jgi:hypothetical protein
MAMRDKLIETSAPYLRPGEPVQAVNELCPEFPI